MCSYSIVSSQKSGFTLISTICMLKFIGLDCKWFSFNIRSICSTRMPFMTELSTCTLQSYIVYTIQKWKFVNPFVIFVLIIKKLCCVQTILSFPFTGEKYREWMLRKSHIPGLLQAFICSQHFHYVILCGSLN